MSTKTQKRKAVAVAGAVVGVGAVIAGAVAMSKQKNQKKVCDAMTKAKEMVDKYSKDAQNKTESLKDTAMMAGAKVHKNFFKGKKNLKKVASSVLEKVEKVTKVAKKEVKKI